MNDPKMSETQNTDNQSESKIPQDQIGDDNSSEENLAQEDTQAQQQDQEQASIDELKTKIAVLCEALESAKDKSLRAQAEVENIRRRTTIEQANIRKYAIEGFATELLAVKDSLDLAEKVELSEDNKDVINKMQEGLSLTLKQLQQVFAKFSIENIAPEKGDKLNPELHQAMTIQPSDEVEPNCIVNVFQNGYKLNDRLLRPAMVVIARKPDEKSEQSE